jgi:hypothetical protein
VIARQSVWSNPEIQELLTKFVVCADEVARLQNGSDPECRLAQKVFEQGHYAGRTVPTPTRQGTYATAPSGVMLGSINSRDPKEMADMLRRSLLKWNAMTPEERVLGVDPGKQQGDVKRGETQYPADGLVLRVFSRDLPRSNTAKDWRATAWNQDYAWFTRAEVQSMVPQKLEAGQSQKVPKPLVDRLAKFNFVDNVRGQTMAFADADITVSNIEIQVTKVVGNVASLKLTGETKAAKEGVWSIAGHEDRNSPQTRLRSMSLQLLGTASFDIAKSRFTQFDAVATGTRVGGTQYNGRSDDLGSAPIGFALGLASGKASERVAPSFFRGYRWPRG